MDSFETFKMHITDLKNRGDQGKKFVDSVNKIINVDWVSHK